MKTNFGLVSWQGLRKLLCFTAALMFISYFLPAQGANYQTPKQMGEWLHSQQKSHGKVMTLEVLSSTPGKEPVYLVKIGQSGTEKMDHRPAILVVANPSGHMPIASEAAILLIERLLADPGQYKDIGWYLVPSLSPDAHKRFFSSPKVNSRLNGRKVNDDRDDQEGEDPPDDLNGDGLITWMRVADPQGEWLPIDGEPRLMRRADHLKGERGLYKLSEEGFDNDDDGQTNEDGPGGVDVGINFPHLFPAEKPEAGEWPGSETESFNLIRFVAAHREIAMTLVLGETNFCFQPPQGGRRGSVDFSKITVPERFASRFGFETDRTYSMQEIMVEAQKMAPPGMELTEAMVASFLGLGAVVNPLPEDLKFYDEVSKQYKEYFKKVKLPLERFDPVRDRDGSLELWSYYHMGLPSFSLDFWWVPKPEKKKDSVSETITMKQLADMSNEDFLALGEEKIDTFLKNSGAPKQFGAAMVMKMVKDGQMNTKRMAEMMKQMGGDKGDAGKEEGKADPREEALLKYSDEKLDKKGFVAWKKVKHPVHGDVDVGGFVPYINQNPPAEQIKTILDPQIPWIFELASNRARLSIHSSKVKELGAGLYRLSVWVENTGLLPYPTAMGKRNERTAPVVVSLEGEGIECLSGKKRELISSVGGHSVAKAEWLIRVKNPVSIRIRMTSNYAGSDLKTVRIGGDV